MKRLFFVLALVATITGVYAQPPGGRRPNGGPRGERPPMGGMRDQDNGQNKMWIEKFPDIPDLTLEQRRKLGEVLSDEQKSVEKQLENKRSYQAELDANDLSEKEIQKLTKKIGKANESIAKQKEKSDKKIKKILSDSQYKVFSEKRDEFKFNKLRRPHQRPDNERRPQRPDDDNGFPLEQGSEFN